jgi:hypothetical protein
MTMTPVKLRKACDKVGGVYAMARLFSKGHPPQYLYRRSSQRPGALTMAVGPSEPCMPSFGKGGGRGRDSEGGARSLFFASH